MREDGGGGGGVQRGRGKGSGRSGALEIGRIWTRALEGALVGRAAVGRVVRVATRDP